MRKGIICVLFAVVLQGCSIFDVIKPQDDQVTIHPELPRPVQPINVDWQIITKDDQVLVATPYDDFLTVLENDNDIVRFIDQLVNTVCYYRQDLDEEFCKGTSNQ